jgi:hypothetical protein
MMTGIVKIIPAMIIGLNEKDVFLGSDEHKSQFFHSNAHVSLEPQPPKRIIVSDLLL